MSVQYKAGAKLGSTACDGQILVLRVPAVPIDLRIGGAPVVVGTAADKVALDPLLAGGTQTGKRYTDEAETMEFLCTKGGAGSISVDGAVLGIKAAKALPSSD
ncbi:MAG: hypothetical protein H7268_10745 [Sandarakinorhabdus sp.]|nr:hypothetical protein [Sandarakinorhabdus sp.]